MEMSERIAEIISEQLSVPIAHVVPAANLMDDLNADSLDIVELIMTVEEAYDIEIEDVRAEKITTVQDIMDEIGSHHG